MPMSRNKCCTTWPWIEPERSSKSRGFRAMRTTICSVGILTALSLAGLAFGTTVDRKDLRFKVGKHPMISINNQYGPVTVKTGAPHAVVVTAFLHSDKVEL